jgi:hypothetical protein
MMVAEVNGFIPIYLFRYSEKRPTTKSGAHDFEEGVQCGRVTYKDGSRWTASISKVKRCGRNATASSPSAQLVGEVESANQRRQLFSKSKKREPLLFKRVANDY